jgi:hypothetical protein
MVSTYTVTFPTVNPEFHFHEVWGAWQLCAT